MNRPHAYFLRKVAELRSWLSAITRRNLLEADMEAELNSHFENLRADLVR